MPMPHSLTSMCVGVSLSYAFPVDGTVFATCLPGLCKAWLFHLQARSFISSSVGRCPVCHHSSSFQILLGQQIRRSLLRHLIMNACNFRFSSLVGLQVYAPYKSQKHSTSSQLLVMWTAISVSASLAPASPSQCAPGYVLMCLLSCLQYSQD